jgi:CubicO group peptidase (beta-lactamase class C family)
MKNYIIAFFLVFTFIVNAQTKSIQKSPPLAEASPESVGMSSERLSRIDKMCQETIAENGVPGMVALVARKGKIVYHKAFGYADNTSKKELKTNAIFRIASQTKAITSTAVMMLWEEGNFKLDDPVSKYIPEFKNPHVLDTYNENDGSYTTVPADKEITIRHLLTHTSGIGYGVIDSDERFKTIYKKAGITDLFSIEL